MAINGVFFFYIKQDEKYFLEFLFRAYLFFYPVFIAAMATIDYSKHLPPASILFWPVP